MSQDPRPDDTAINAAAREFRAALDAIDRTDWLHIHIGKFPRGACGHCAELLVRHLHKRFGITPDYVSCNLEGENGRIECGYACLEWNGLLIDISGDQFGWAPVIVTRTPGPDYTVSRLNTRHRWALDPDWWGQQCGAIWHAAQSYLARRPCGSARSFFRDQGLERGAEAALPASSSVRPSHPCSSG